MLKSDYSKHDELPLWAKHEYIEFDSAGELMTWVSDDKQNFNLSDRVYDAMVDCLENAIDECIVATVEIKGLTTIDVLIRKENFQKILSAYTKRLLEIEDYERLLEIKKEIQRFDLQI